MIEWTYNPNYKGYVDKLNQFIIKNIDVEKILNSVSENTRLLSDTLEITFVISKVKQMSNLYVTSIQNTVLPEEIQQVLIKSSCNWVPGSSSGRYLNGRFRNKLVFTIDRRGDLLSVKTEWLESFTK